MGQDNPAGWAVRLPLSIVDDDPFFRRLATHTWIAQARRRGAVVKLVAVHRWVTGHIADVFVDGVPYLICVQDRDGWSHVLAVRDYQSRFSRCG